MKLHDFSYKAFRGNEDVFYDWISSFNGMVAMSLAIAVGEAECVPLHCVLMEVSICLFKLSNKFGETTV